ncbi:FHA domain-containing protein [Corallococcus coralloides DSM 2259]|uniref:FHA domain-containing protein n=1 Tax=Corallococcus coralloides (strain ATCC 25202 / DSM 2259 / NBRC 100086 / M2) TaxID=1144275 RepID=H8MJG5_CORCM|nr:FHA domain-containing protein [Corallococcus coralloides]AFE05967.1 FHA domain-containing protein [Corallococcus coralloides DSM 2259]
MLSVQELRALASALPVGAFQHQLGPFALVQRPPSELSAAALAPTRMADPGDVEQGMLALLFEFDDLLVATLPTLKDSDVLRIGRRLDCELVLDDGSVSKQHAELKWSRAAGRCTVRDLGSTNGTFVNASTIGQREVPLRGGDILSFGNVQFWYLLTDALHERLRAGAASGLGSHSG